MLLSYEYFEANNKLPSFFLLVSWSSSQFVNKSNLGLGSVEFEILLIVAAFFNPKMCSNWLLDIETLYHIQFQKHGLF